MTKGFHLYVHAFSSIFCFLFKKLHVIPFFPDLRLLFTILLSYKHEATRTATHTSPLQDSCRWQPLTAPFPVGCVVSTYSHP